MTRPLSASMQLLLAVITSTFFISISDAAPVILIEENFDTADFASRGWYDNTSGGVSTAEHITGSAASFECRFLLGATKCNGTAMRHLFTETDSLYVSYYVKYSSNWQGSNKTYHPHEFQILTNVDSAYTGPSRTHLTTYIEQNEGKPRLQITDALNIDTSNIGQDLVGITEQRGVSGCNGDSDGYGAGDCWACSGGYCNEKVWMTNTIYFQDNAGAYYKNDWHKIEAFFKLNSISNGKGVADGVIQYWYDGQLIINHNNVMLRTGQSPSMKFNQFLIAPYIGDGSPVEQTMWIDNLTLATARPDTRPNPPTNLKVE